MKIPLLGVIGAKEAETGAISLRSRRDGDLGALPLADLISRAVTANQQRLAGLADS
jgi:threonyl-tRNA synthetase